MVKDGINGTFYVEFARKKMKNKKRKFTKPHIYTIYIYKSHIILKYALGL